MLNSVASLNYTYMPHNIQSNVHHGNEENPRETIPKHSHTKLYRLNIKRSGSTKHRLPGPLTLSLKLKKDWMVGCKNFMNIFE